VEVIEIEKEKIPCFAPESMAVLCGMFYTCKAQISNLLSNCKQIIEITYSKGRVSAYSEAE
jgi:hypothetical protein